MDSNPIDPNSQRDEVIRQLYEQNRILRQLLTQNQQVQNDDVQIVKIVKKGKEMQFFFRKNFFNSKLGIFVILEPVEDQFGNLHLSENLPPHIYGYDPNDFQSRNQVD